MIEKIESDSIFYALIIRKDFEMQGVEFFTPSDFSQQLGYMQWEKGHNIQPHAHRLVERKVKHTQEVLFVKSGSVRVDFYDIEDLYYSSITLFSGDVILLAEGGHGFEMLENTEIVEVKQGPYAGDDDKRRFDVNRRGSRQ